MVIVQKFSKDTLVCYRYEFWFFEGNLVLKSYDRLFRVSKNSSWRVSHQYRISPRFKKDKYSIIVPERSIKISDDIAAKALAQFVDQVNVGTISQFKQKS